MRILMISSEAAPYAKTGGLADVVSALPAALAPLGHSAAVLIPRYRSVPLAGMTRVYDHLPVWLGSARFDTSVYRAPGPIPFFFLDCPPLYDRDGFYADAEGDFPDNHIRFAVLARAALAISRVLFRADIFHCHDWQASLVPVYLKRLFAGDPTFGGVKSILTIHNLGYQGLFPATALPEIGLDRGALTPATLGFHGQMNYLQGGINFADALTTVSRGYAREIQTPEYGSGLDGLLATRSGALTGILNGVDYAEWNPETDKHLAANYSADDLRGKAACRRDLLREFGFPEDNDGRPLLGIVSRFTQQKGADLIAAIGDRLALEDVRLVALGTGEPEYEEIFRTLAERYPEKIRVRIGFSNPLAHKIEAGSDIFLMPSRYEPCGLNQMYSLRYGTLPVVRATGGLDDTIDEETGFKFREYSGEALLGAIRTACAAYREPQGWRGMMRRGMLKDYSWEASARDYAALYQRVAGSAQ